MLRAALLELYMFSAKYEFWHSIQCQWRTPLYHIFLFPPYNDSLQNYKSMHYKILTMLQVQGIDIFNSIRLYEYRYSYKATRQTRSPNPEKNNPNFLFKNHLRSPSPLKVTLPYNAVTQKGLFRKKGLETRRLPAPVVTCLKGILRLCHGF